MIQKHLIFLGGDDMGDEDGIKFREKYKTTEFISNNEPPKKCPDLPFTLFGHFMVKYNENSIFIIGGDQNDELSDKSWIIDPSKQFQIKEGPSLHKARAYASCGKMEINGKTFLVVAGGATHCAFDFLKSAELLDPTSDQGWIQGTITEI